MIIRTLLAFSIFLWADPSLAQQQAFLTFSQAGDHQDFLLAVPEGWRTEQIGGLEYVNSDRELRQIALISSLSNTSVLGEVGISQGTVGATVADEMDILLVSLLDQRDYHLLFNENREFMSYAFIDNEDYASYISVYKSYKNDVIAITMTASNIEMLREIMVSLNYIAENSGFIVPVED